MEESMSLLATARKISISTGLYRPANWLLRRIQPRLMAALHDDISLYRSLLPAGALCFDVGANVGAKSEALLGAGLSVVAFEPNPRVLPELLARCGSHKNFRSVAAALGSSAAITTLYARESHWQSSLDEAWEGKQIATYNVPVVTLDAAIQRFGSPAFCKIDVEGWELEVLKGLSQPIPLISIEFHLNDRDLKKTLTCLERLLHLGMGDVNITPAEDASFLFPEWVPLEKFIAGFPGALHQSLSRHHYGDIFIRSSIPTSL